MYCNPCILGNTKFKRANINDAQGVEILKAILKFDKLTRPRASKMGTTWFHQRVIDQELE